MTFNTKFKDVLTALETYLKAQFSTYSIYIGKSSPAAPKLVDVSINAGRGQTTGHDGLWKFPIVLIIAESGEKEEVTAGVAGAIMEKVQDFFTANNAEPLTTSGYWGRVTSCSPLDSNVKGFYNRWLVHGLIYVYEPEYGTLGTVRIICGAVDITFSVGVDLQYSITKPGIEYVQTSNALPEGVDRRSHFVDFNLNAILMGATARADCLELVTLLETQLGDMSSNKWTVILTGALAAMFGTTRYMGPAPGTACRIRAIDGDQYVIRITGLNFREVRT